MVSMLPTNLLTLTGVKLDPVQIASLLGAVMQLLAYALMQLGRLPSQSYLNHEYGFILMEGVWFLTSAYGLLKLMRAQGESHAPL